MRRCTHARFRASTGSVASRLALVSSAVVALALSACDRPVTEVVLVVNTDYPMPGSIDTIRIEIDSVTSSADMDALVVSPVREFVVPIADGGLPASGYTLGIRSSGALDAAFGIAVIGLHGGMNGTEVTRSEIRTAFRPHERRVVNVLLTRRCDGWVCPEAGVCAALDRGYECRDPSISPDQLPTALRCPAGRAHCGVTQSPLCETDLQSDVMNCGTCDHACDTGDGCVAGLCQHSRIARLASSATETCALRDSRHVVCWGRVTGTTGPFEPPHPLPTDFDDVVDLAGGRIHMCIVRSGGALLCWGDNTYRQLGPAVTVSSSAVPVLATTGVFVAVAAGAGHTCGVTSAHGILCWGRNDYGQVGAPASMTPVITPTVVRSDLRGTPQPYNNALEITAGDDFTCSRSDNSDSNLVVCWGNNQFGQLGIGPIGTPSEIARRAQSPLAGGTQKVLNVSAGSHHACASTMLDPHLGRFAGQILCWGDNHDGQLGDGSAMAMRAGPQFVSLPMSEPASEVIAFGNSTCAIGATNGGIWCWGANGSGELGTGTTVPFDVPHDVPWHRRSVRTAGGGWGTDTSGHLCLSHEFGSVRCWGSNAGGPLGIDTADSPSLVPVSVPSLP